MCYSQLWASRMNQAAVSTSRSRLGLLAPSAVVISCGLLAYIGIVDPLGPGDQRCHQAHVQPCVDALGADITIHYHQNVAIVADLCGDLRSNACALRTFSFGSASCDIHILTDIPHHVLEHELNHCRGWDHAGDTKEAYEAPWHLNRDAWVVRGTHR